MQTPDFKKQLRVLERFRYGKRIHPERDWLILLGIASLLLLVSGAWNVWVFMTGSDIQPSMETATTTPEISPYMLDETTVLFENREREEERYRNEYRFVDPTL